jgi:hypothetical protein
MNTCSRWRHSSCYLITTYTYIDKRSDAQAKNVGLILRPIQEFFTYYEDVTTADGMLGAQGLWAGEGGIFIVLHLLWHGTSVFPVASYDTHGDAEDLFETGSSRGLKRWKSETTYNNHFCFAYIKLHTDNEWPTLLEVHSWYTCSPGSPPPLSKLHHLVLKVHQKQMGPQSTWYCAFNFYTIFSNDFTCKQHHSAKFPFVNKRPGGHLSSPESYWLIFCI